MKRKMKKWKIFLALGITYLAYYIGGVFYAIRQDVLKSNELELKAKQKADANNDGELESEEVLMAYKTIGYNGYQMLGKLSNMEDYRRFIERSQGTEYSKRVFFQYCLDLIDSERVSGGRFTHYYRYGYHLSLSKALADKNDDGKISVEEAKEAFYLVHGREEVPLRLSVLRECSLIDSMKSFIFPYGSGMVEGSELEKYVNSEKAPLK